MKRILACAAFLLCHVAHAQQCGIYKGTLLKDGFGPPDASFVMEPEATLPPESTTLALTVAAPADNVVVGTRSVQVYGTYAGPPAVGVAINQISAVQTANQYVGQVVLSPGSNTITVKLTKLTGETETVTRTVTYDPQQQPDVELLAEIEGEHAPIKPSFTIEKNGAMGLTVTRLQIDYDNDGTLDIDTTNPNAALSFEYRNPGFYTASANITLDDGDPETPPIVRTSTQRIAVVPLPLTRATICYVFYRLKDRLAANDIPDALNSISSEERTFYSNRFGKIKNLPAIALKLGTVVDGKLGIDIASIKLRQIVNDTPRGASVSFERIEDGVWRITSM